MEAAKPKVPAPAPVHANRPIRTSNERGLLYMCFGEAAVCEMTKSIQSLRNVGSDLPVAVVGDNKTAAVLDLHKAGVKEFIHWTGQDPFDKSQDAHFQFRAGRVKPFLYDLSPFKETLYIDCDVEFLIDIEMVFNHLKHWDFIIAQERLMLSELYNRPRAGWKHNIIEKGATIDEFAGNGDIPFLNSGMFLWRKNKKVKSLFELWHEEWLKFQQWDEQAALMRALNTSEVRLFVLSEIWNYPHRDEIKEEKVWEKARVILHEYGRGAARTDVE
jgi:hypothetical protein